MIIAHSVYIKLKVVLDDGGSVVVFLRSGCQYLQLPRPGQDFSSYISGTADNIMLVRKDFRLIFDMFLVGVRTFEDCYDLGVGLYRLCGMKTTAIHQF